MTRVPKLAGKTRPAAGSRAAYAAISSQDVAAHLQALKATLRSVEACMVQAGKARDALKAEIAAIERRRLQ